MIHVAIHNWAMNQVQLLAGDPHTDHMLLHVTEMFASINIYRNELNVCTRCLGVCLAMPQYDT